MATVTEPGGQDLFRDLDLDEFITQRKSALKQKTKFKQLEAFKRIAHLNWSNTDGLHPLQILPKEMWSLVLDFVQNPHDLQHASDCCPLFAKLLEPRRISDILMPLALEVPRFRARLDLIRLRRVCKSLRALVDECFEASGKQFLLIYPYEEEDGKYPKLEELSNYETQISSRVRLPIRSWKIFLMTLHQDENLQPDPKSHFNFFFDCLKQNLQPVGEQLYEFSLSIRCLSDLIRARISMTELYSLLRELVLLMPNLRSLKLNWSNVSSDGRCTKPERGIYDFIRTWPFPILQRLEELEFTIGRVTHDEEMVAAVVRSSPQLKRLTLHPTFYFPDDLLAMVKALPLESLKLRFNCGDDTTRQGFLGMSIRSKPKWRLKHLTLSFRKIRVYLPELFEFLDEFEELESLDLTCHTVLIMDSDMVGLLKLPKLKRFRFRYVGTFEGILELVVSPITDRKYKETIDCVCNGFTSSLDYMINSEALEEIRWENEVVHGIKHGANSRRNDVISFDSGMADLCRSNVWTVFPALKRLYVVRHGDETKLELFCRGKKLEADRYGSPNI